MGGEEFFKSGQLGDRGDKLCLFSYEICPTHFPGGRNFF